MTSRLIKSLRITSVLTSPVFFFSVPIGGSYVNDTYDFCDIFQLEIRPSDIYRQYTFKLTGSSALTEGLCGSVSDYHIVIICGSFVVPFLKSETRNKTR